MSSKPQEIAGRSVPDMRMVVQRVKEARVSVDGQVCGEIAKGLLVLLGVGQDDTEADALYLAEKTLSTRVFPDEAGKMNRDLREAEGGLLVVSQFTLYGDGRKGRRPSFDAAARPEKAKQLYEYYVETARKSGVRVQTGVFQATMEVSLVNDGPVTLLFESRKLF